MQAVIAASYCLLQSDGQEREGGGAVGTQAVRVVNPKSATILSANPRFPEGEAWSSHKSGVTVSRRIGVFPTPKGRAPERSRQLLAEAMLNQCTRFINENSSSQGEEDDPWPRELRNTVLVLHGPIPRERSSWDWLWLETIRCGRYSSRRNRTVSRTVSGTGSPPFRAATKRARSSASSASRSNSSPPLDRSSTWETRPSASTVTLSFTSDSRPMRRARSG